MVALRAAAQPAVRDQLRRELLRRLAETREPYFDVLIEHGVPPAGPVTNISKRWTGGVAPVWDDLIKRRA